MLLWVGAVAGVGAIALFGGPGGWIVGLVAIWSNGVMLNHSHAEIEAGATDRHPALYLAPIAGLVAAVLTVIGIARG